MQASDHSPAAQLPGRAAFPHRHLTGIAGLQPHEIVFLLDEAEQWVEANRTRAKSDKRLEGLTQINAFFENSTRTLLSFEIAGKRLGADVVNMHAAQSSVKKGETLIDTAVTLNAMRADVIVIRHMSSGAVDLIAEKVDCPVLNAGDGWHEHPTQALLDALTIRRRRGSVAGQRVVICGDILHSRVARSNMLALTALAAEVRVVAPSTLMPAAIERMYVQPFTDFDAALEGADVVMTGVSWRPGCPVPLADLRAVRVTYRGFDGRAHTGTIIVHRAVAAGVVDVMSRTSAVRTFTEVS